MMKKWAENEVKIAMEKADGYGRACMKSALKAFNSLCDDGHSGNSIYITKQIFDRLIEGKPLTPVQNTSDEWTFLETHNGCSRYQNKRISSLFKDVSPHGGASFCDVNRAVFYDVDTNSNWCFGLTNAIADEMFPIAMPYYPPDKPFTFIGNEILYDTNNGDFDTIQISCVKDPNGKTHSINRYFRESRTDEVETYPGWVEISDDEWVERFTNASNKKKIHQPTLK